MKKLISLAVFLMAATAVAAPPAKVPFNQVVYWSAAGSGSSTGSSADNALPLDADADIFTIPANTVIEKVYVVIDVAVSGTTGFDVGDDDDGDGFVDGSSSITLGSAGIYGYEAARAGQYLRLAQGVEGGTGNYMVPQAKYYSASGKEVKLDITGTPAAGSGKIVIEGYRF